MKKSHISIYDLKTKSTKVVYSADELIEAPNWSPDGKYLLVNTGGNLYQLPVTPGSKPKLQKIDVGVAKCNNDKGYSPDGKTLAFSSSAQAKNSQVYTSPLAGGTTPQRIVPETPQLFPRLFTGRQVDGDRGTA